MPGSPVFDVCRSHISLKYRLQQLLRLLLAVHAAPNVMTASQAGVVLVQWCEAVTSNTCQHLKCGKVQPLILICCCL